MADFPALEVLTNGAHQLLVGTRIPLVSPFRIGSAKDNTLTVPTADVAPRHCEVVHEYDRWWVRDLGTTHGTFHLGERIHDAELRDGDVFELPASVCFRLLLREPIDLRDEQMEQALIELPDDAQRWSVYADWLQEHGAPLGERLANPREGEHRRWLGPLAGFAGRGVLQVSWAHGVPAKAVLRNLAPTGWQVSWERPLALLRSETLFRFLRVLELDLVSFHRASLESSWADRVLALLGNDFPMLETLVLGPGEPPPDADLLAPQLRARRELHPRFSTTTRSLFRPWRAATLTFEGKAHALDPAVTLHAGTELGPGCPPFGIFWEDERWRLSTTSGELRVNGVVRRTALLRRGDVIEPRPGLQLHFDA
ncbi:MAG: FHA domain-containing protein [Archangium sp.]|nr:FHA domain-containing protein [Archangium sp.]MDP3569492.1 FHA domain-containing protein [Archangium sp.]